MNYQKHYDNLIQSRKKACSFGNLEYWEKHHIVPKCLKGIDEPENLVLLTAREHYIAHWLLTKIYKENDSLKYAFYCMQWNKNKRTLTSRQVERLKILFNLINKNKKSEHAKNKMKIAWLKRKLVPISEETRKKYSERFKKMWEDEKFRQKMKEIKDNLNLPGPMSGKKHSEETKQKISKANTGKKHSEETKQKMKGRKISEETKQKMKNAWKEKFPKWNWKE